LAAILALSEYRPWRRQFLDLRVLSGKDPEIKVVTRATEPPPPDMIAG
jgi:hypothetical protein